MTMKVIDVVDKILRCQTNSVQQEGIADIEEWLKEQEQATAIIEISAKVEDGMYFRSSVIPPNVLCVGASATRPCVVVVKRGKLTVWTLDGRKDLEGPIVITAKAGLKRVGYTETEVEWVNIFNVDDLQGLNLEQELFDQAFDLLHKLGV